MTEPSLRDMTDEQLVARLGILYETWPSDGWDGAADVIATHANKAYSVEIELHKRHRASGKHGPKHPYYDRCVCREEQSKTTPADAFHKHLDGCAQCRRNPMGLCSVGQKLLTGTVEGQ